MYVKRPLDFSIFPSLLLIATLFRLSLNVAATRLILSDANAGKVISAVGSYVVGGNYVIGLIVFLILIVVQYVVVTNGAQRVSEVAARFTLDSMPGQQMSIDADLNMGFIDQAEAQRRRKNLEREAGGLPRCPGRGRAERLQALDLEAIGRSFGQPMPRRDDSAATNRQVGDFESVAAPPAGLGDPADASRAAGRFAPLVRRRGRHAGLLKRIPRPSFVLFCITVGLTSVKDWLPAPFTAARRRRLHISFSYSLRPRLVGPPPRDLKE